LSYTLRVESNGAVARVLQVKTILLITFSVAALRTISLALAEEKQSEPALKEDRVGFPKDYRNNLKVLRVVERPEKKQVVTVYGNKEAATVTSTNQLPYPYGALLVMETAEAKSADSEKTTRASSIKPGEVVGLHVMRKERGFGEAYKHNRSGEWEYAEYKADGSYITPPAASASCASCHIKAGAATDFVYNAGMKPGK
jgi:hypothetical protein